MSRVAKKPINIPKGVEFNVQEDVVTVKGPKGALDLKLHPTVIIKQEEGVVTVEPVSDSATAMAGTMRSLLANLVVGVSDGFEKRLQLVGVGYRAQMQGTDLNLNLGFSHPVHFKPPEGVSIETPSQTEVVVRGIDKQKVGQAAAVIRGFRPPEPYKGKGVRYMGERIVMKEAKKA
ncbi:MAG: 50S ribosomal protein L6 [Xanthomonadales bacterium]|nr:50S ribosomal protein L6 [Xanthomonadales bacterium]